MCKYLNNRNVTIIFKSCSLILSRLEKCGLFLRFKAFCLV